MTESWREWEGRTVDGKFVLGSYLGGSDGSAVFQTRADRRMGTGEEIADAAIKLIALDGVEAETQLRRWKVASELRHPNLIHILTVGQAAMEGRELVYAVEEYAEENVAQILPERALTAEEARGMLGPVLGALEFVHGKGMVLGRIRPSNILASGDQVKLSSDNVGRAGEISRTLSALYDAPEVAASGISAASDVWSLGITLVEVLTQHVPVWDVARLEMSSLEVEDGVPEPFRGIAQRCLQVDPAKRCGMREIGELLEGKRAQATAAPVEGIAAARKKKVKWPVLVAAMVIGLAILITMRPHTAPAPAKDQTSSGASQGAPTPPAQQVGSSESMPAPAQAGASETAATGGREKAAAKDEIVQRVMPQVSRSAQRTIEGKIKVRVRVKVDAAGNVAEAKLKEAGPSKYFARVAVEAARRWKFAPTQDEIGREWTLLFAFSRARTEASAARAR